MATRERNRPESLKQGTTAADRRVLSAVKVNQAAPSAATDGEDTGSNDWLHIMLEVPDAATSFDWLLWEYDEASELWAIRTDIGTPNVNTSDSPDLSVIQIVGSRRVYVQVLNMVGTFTSGVNLWLSGSTF